MVLTRLGRFGRYSRRSVATRFRSLEAFYGKGVALHRLEDLLGGLIHQALRGASAVGIKHHFEGVDRGRISKDRVCVDRVFQREVMRCKGRRINLPVGDMLEELGRGAGVDQPGGYGHVPDPEVPQVKNRRTASWPRMVPITTSGTSPFKM